jgi:hypothetical protein
MLNVFSSVVENIEKNKTSLVNCLIWDEDMKMIIEFDFKKKISSRI